MGAPPARASLDASALELLLGFLGGDAQGRGYADARAMLEGFFRWNGRPDPTSLADVTLDRVAKKLAAGEVEATAPRAYLLAVARLVLLEDGRQVAREQRTALQAATVAVEAPTHEEAREREVRLAALEGCLAELDAAQRALLLRYHEEDGRKRIDGRQTLAAELGIPLNALRVRTFRIRARIEACVGRRLQALSASASSLKDPR